jgi:hypothetical protein
VTAGECAIDHTSRRAAPGEPVDRPSIGCIFSSATFVLTSALRESLIEPLMLSSVILGMIVITMASFGGGLSTARSGA